MSESLKGRLSPSKDVEATRAATSTPRASSDDLLKVSPKSPTSSSSRKKKRTSKAGKGYSSLKSPPTPVQASGAHIDASGTSASMPPPQSLELLRDAALQALGGDGETESKTTPSVAKYACRQPEQAPPTSNESAMPANVEEGLQQHAFKTEEGEPSEHSAPFLETEEIRQKALAEMEEALELIECKDALMEARQRMPELVNKEADPIRFLRFEKYNVWAAARRLAVYWKVRKETFGPDRAFLPMNQTGEGTLTRDDIAVLHTGGVAFLPYDEKGRSVVCLDTSRRSSQDQKRRRRVMFYVGSILCENPATQKDGFVALSIFRAPTLDQVVRENVNLLFQAFPLRLHKLHIVNCPNGNSNKKSYLETMIPVALQLLGKLTGDKTIIHVGDSKAELCAKLAEYGLAKKNLPKSIGGDWNYESFVQWADWRMRYEWDLPAGTSNKDIGNMRGIMFRYPVKQFSDLTEEEKAERKRRMNVLHSRRKRERQKIEVEVLQEQVDDLRSDNQRIASQNRQYEDLLEQAKAKIRRIDQSAFSGSLGPSAATVQGSSSPMEPPQMQSAPYPVDMRLQMHQPPPGPLLTLEQQMLRQNIQEVMRSRSTNLMAQGSDPFFLDSFHTGGLRAPAGAPDSFPTVRRLGNAPPFLPTGPSLPTPTHGSPTFASMRPFPVDNRNVGGSRPHPWTLPSWLTEAAPAAPSNTDTAPAGNSPEQEEEKREASSPSSH